MDSIIKKLVGDLVKGAAQAEGFVRGSRMRVDLGGDLVGQKFASELREKLSFFTMSDPAQVAQRLVHGTGPVIGAAKQGPPPIPAAAKKGPPPIPVAAKAAHDAGIKAAAERFGIKEAFLPALLAAAGPMLARAGLGRLAAGAGGKMLGGIAGKIAPRVAGGMGGAMFDHAAGAAGGMLGQRLMPQQQQPQPMGPMG